MLGRFGWKAGQPTVLQQSAEAFSGDIGIGTLDRSPGLGRLHGPAGAVSRGTARRL